MKQKTINTTWLPLIYGVAFAVLAWVILVVKNSDLLFTAQDRSIFLHTPEFLAENLAVPGGLLSWAGCYLIQFFITPWWGSAILIVMWLLIYWLTIECFNLKGAWSALALIPVCALLASIVDVGYWLYYLKVPGYWMKETLALLIVLLVYWGYKKVQGVQGEFKGSSRGVSSRGEFKRSSKGVQREFLPKRISRDDGLYQEDYETGGCHTQLERQGDAEEVSPERFDGLWLLRDCGR